MNKKKIVILLMSLLMLIGCVASSLYFHSKESNKINNETNKTIETANSQNEKDVSVLSENNVICEDATEELAQDVTTLEDTNTENSDSGSSVHGGTTIQASNDSQESETTEIPNEPVIPVTTETPSAPTVPSTTETPSVPTAPSTTEAPVTTETPSEPVEPTTAVAADDSTEGKTWVPPVYKEVWVVDQEACTIENPVYEVVYVSYCNGCGAVITGDPDEHMKSRLLAGHMECGGYTTVPEYVQVGVEVIEVPEQGHWEKVLVQEGYWI